MEHFQIIGVFVKLKKTYDSPSRVFYKLNAACPTLVQIFSLNVYMFNNNILDCVVIPYACFMTTGKFWNLSELRTLYMKIKFPYIWTQNILP